MQFLSFPCDYVVFSTSFIKDCHFPNKFCLLRIQMLINTYVKFCFWALHSVPLLYVCPFMLGTYCFDYYIFVVLIVLQHLYLSHFSLKFPKDENKMSRIHILYKTWYIKFHRSCFISKFHLIKIK